MPRRREGAPPSCPDGRVETPLLAVARQDGREIEPLSHRVSDEVSEVSLRHELVHRTRQQPALVHVPRTECLGHAPSESSRNTAVEHYSDRLLAMCDVLNGTL